MGIQAAPANVGVALALHYSLMDDIWHLCGDKATDLSWCAAWHKPAPLAAHVWGVVLDAESM